MVLGKPTRPCTVKRIGPLEFRVILTEGRNRQIRRMCQALGYRVEALHRVRIMHIRLGKLPEGQWTAFSDAELRELFAQLGRAKPAETSHSEFGRRAE
jgi:23S rRNA pseudouridine2604 synthase